MPVLVEEAEIKLEWADIQRRVQRKKPKGTEHRSTGVHLSGVIKHCLIETGKLTAGEIENEFFPLRMAIGMAIEEWVVGLWPEIRWQPGEQELDGVFGSPDGITVPKERYLTGPKVLEEFKATWKSRRTYGDVVNQPLWMWQLAGYCKMLGLTEARMHIFWMCGDYKMGPPEPKYVTYRIRFTQEEVDRFWVNVVLKNKDQVVGEVH